MTAEITNISQLLAKIEESNQDWPSVRPGTILMRNRIDNYVNFYKILRLEIDKESQKEFPENILVYYSNSLDGEKEEEKWVPVKFFERWKSEIEEDEMVRSIKNSGISNRKIMYR